MARTRKVESDAILDAAERVILRQGMSRFSLDAVAKEAGISKTRVVYDFKSKLDLMGAMLERQYSRDMACLKELEKECMVTPHPELFTRIKQAERVPDDSDKAISMVISAAMLSESTLQKKIQDWVCEDIAAVSDNARPRASMVAYFALMGFCCHEWFGLVSWKDDKRRAILEDIRKAYLHFPENQK